MQKSAHSTLVDGMPTLPHPTDINFVNFSPFAVLEFSDKTAVHVYVHTVTAMSQILLHHAREKRYQTLRVLFATENSVGLETRLRLSGTCNSQGSRQHRNTGLLLIK